MRLVQIDSEFKKNIQNYGGVDGMFAIILFWVMCLVYTLLAVGYIFCPILIYQKTNSLYGAIIPHCASNLVYELVVRE